MILVSLSETMKREIGRLELLVSFADYQQTSPTEAVIAYFGKQYQGIIHTANDGLHWTEIIAEIRSEQA